MTDDADLVDVLRVLVLLQAAAALLAMVGELVFMAGDPLYAVVPVAKVVFLLVLVGRIGRGRRWAAVTMLALQAVSVLAFWVNLAVGVFPAIDVTVTLVSLMMDLALPIGVIVVCLWLLVTRAGRGAMSRPERAVPVDPWPSAPITDTLPFPTGDAVGTAPGPGVGAGRPAVGPGTGAALPLGLGAGRGRPAGLGAGAGR